MQDDDARSADPHAQSLDNGDTKLDDYDIDYIPEYAKGLDGTPEEPFGSAKKSPKSDPKRDERIRCQFSQFKHSGSADDGTHDFDHGTNADDGREEARDDRGDTAPVDGRNDSGDEGPMSDNEGDARVDDESDGHTDDDTKADSTEETQKSDDGRPNAKGKDGGPDDDDKSDGTTQGGSDIGSASGKPVPILGMRDSKWAI